MWPPFRLGVVGVAPLTAHILVFYFPALKKFKGKFTSAGKFKGENKPRKVRWKMGKGQSDCFPHNFPHKKKGEENARFSIIFGGENADKIECIIHTDVCITHTTRWHTYVRAYIR